MESTITHPLSDSQSPSVVNEKIKRPSNMYMLYRADLLKRRKQEQKETEPVDGVFPKPHHQWSREPPSVKAYWANKQKEVSKTHMRSHPHYKYRPTPSLSVKRTHTSKENNARPQHKCQKMNLKPLAPIDNLNERRTELLLDSTKAFDSIASKNSVHSQTECQKFYQQIPASQPLESVPQPVRQDSLDAPILDSRPELIPSTAIICHIKFEDTAEGEFIFHPEHLPQDLSETQPLNDWDKLLPTPKPHRIWTEEALDTHTRSLRLPQDTEFPEWPGYHPIYSPYLG